MKIITIALLLIIISGCAALNKLQDQSAHEVAQAIIKYCQSTDAYFREDFRIKINEELKSHGISEKVDCEFQN